MKSMAITVVIAGVVVLVLLMLFYKGQTDTVPTPQSNQASDTIPLGSQTPLAINTEATELKIEDLLVGTGDTAVTGKKISVNYRGTLTSGKQFDSSYDRGQPFSFNLGAGDVIAGWDKGLVGMKVGGKRRLTIPASLGYGPQAIGLIPANSTLIFEVELLKVEN